MPSNSASLGRIRNYDCKDCLSCLCDQGDKHYRNRHRKNAVLWRSVRVEILEFYPVTPEENSARPRSLPSNVLDSSWNVMTHGDAWEGKWRGNWRMEWVTSTLHTTSENGVSSITTADAHTSAASSRLNWRPCRFKWARPFRWKTKSGFCACAITFETQSTRDLHPEEKRAEAWNCCQG
jgi:hypothetical protein